ncbi:MAG: hypothetical protein WKF94_02305 [Solirubrobacteraceae bacterium]
MIPGIKQVDAIAGRFVAYRFTDPNFTSDRALFTSVIVLNARSGRRVIDATAFEGQFEEGTAPTVSPLRLIANGTVAWAARDAEDPTRAWAVNIAYPDNRDELEVLDTSPQIDPESVALIPGFVYWTEDGAPQGRAL